MARLAMLEVQIADYESVRASFAAARDLANVVECFLAPASTSTVQQLEEALRRFRATVPVQGDPCK